MGKSSWFTPKRIQVLSFIVSISLLLVPTLGFADVESSLDNVKGHLIHTILPTLSVIGMGIASVSFFTGNPQAKQHIIYAILGCAFGFGAQIISDFISSLVR
jgi:hypothetical protein